jgi:predicted dehydrogenase
MKFLIAGLGSIGRRHLRNLTTLGERNILLYRTHRSTLPEDELAGFPVETDLDAALAHHPDAVIVSNPTALHLDVAIPAAEAGCHLLLEKPISHSLERIEDLKQALQRGGGQALVGFQFRYHPSLNLIANLLAGKGSLAFLPTHPIGKTLSVRVHWGEYLPGWHPWEDYRLGYAARAALGGGVILTLSHPLDYLRWLFGEVESLWCFSGHLSDLETDVEDCAEIGLRFASGLIGSLHLDYCQRPPIHDMEIIGAHGTLRWDNTDGGVKIYTAGETAAWQEYPAPAGFERNHLFLEQMRHFITVINGESEPRCGLHDGIQALKLALAAQQSANEGKIARL